MKDKARERVIAEVIELGEMLFDTAIDLAAPRTALEEASEAALIEEMRAAANEFFTTLRLLLEIEQDIGEPKQ